MQTRPLTIAMTAANYDDAVVWQKYETTNHLMEIRIFILFPVHIKTCYLPNLT
jgi:hypothetical protein